MYSSIQNFLELNVQCPACFSANLQFSENQIKCLNCNSSYPFFRKSYPVLIKKSNNIFLQSDYLDQSNKTQKNFTQRLSSILPTPSVNLNQTDNLSLFGNSLKEYNEAFILVVGGGQQKEKLEDTLGAYKNLIFIYSDIDINAEVDVFCDAHDLPFKNKIFHGVITTAVLEHVLYPERVVQEMSRILVDGGIIYSEIPFLQQVHEGPYDFTRYTLSGHRRLLNKFYELDSGIVAGPGTTLVWSIERLILCFSIGRKSGLFIKAIVRILFFWLKYLDYFIQHSPHAMDGASCTYFLGKKIAGYSVDDQDIVNGYIGAVNLQHV